MKKLKNISNVKAIAVWDTKDNDIVGERLIALFAFDHDAKRFVEEAAELRMVRANTKGSNTTLDYWKGTFFIETKPMSVRNSNILLAEEGLAADITIRQSFPRPLSKKLKYLWNKTIHAFDGRI